MTSEPSARPPRRRLLMTALLALLLALAVVVAVALVGRGQAEQTAAEADTPPLLPTAAPAGEGKPLPDVTLPALRGFAPAGGIDLATLRGRPVVLNFWASWCAPCVAEMPALQRVAADTDISVIGVNYIDQPEKAAALARELGITYDLVRDDDGLFGEQIGLLGAPTTLLVDARGTIVKQLTGELSEQQIREAIAAELAFR